MINQFRRLEVYGKHLEMKSKPVADEPEEDICCPMSTESASRAKT